MSFFSRKKEVDLETVCRLFYDNIIFNCKINGQDINALFFDQLRLSLIDSDSKFVNIDSKKFNYEIVVLQFELFSLAWLYQFGEKLAVAQSTFTKKYLLEKERKDIWDILESYNQAVARSGTAGKSETKPIDRAYLGRVMLMRTDLFDQYHKEGYNLECVARVLNRLFSEDAWKKGVTAGFLLFALCNRLGFDPNFEPNMEAHTQWFIELNDTFSNFKKSLSKIKIK
jgi:hypothetical protein